MITLRKGTRVMVLEEYADGTRLIPAGAIGRVWSPMSGGEVTVTLSRSPFWGLLPTSNLVEITRSQFNIEAFKLTYSHLTVGGASGDRYAVKRDLILSRCEALVSAGFEISGIWYGSSKIRMVRPAGLTKPELLEKIIAAVGNDFSGVTFGRYFMIWYGKK